MDTLKRLLIRISAARINPRAVPLRTLIKGTAIIGLAPYMLLAIYSFYGVLSIDEALFGALFVFVMSVVFVRPYIANLSALTHYVNQLAADHKAVPPNLSFLNNVEELSVAVSRLHQSWEARRNRLESIIIENRILIDTLPHALVMLDEELSIIRTNHTAKLIFGSDAARLLPIIKDERARTIARQVLADEKGRTLEYHADNLHIPTDFFISMERFPVHSAGRIALVIAMHDVTEQKRTEKMLADFVANASHEIRTPLTSLVGFIETLQTTAKDDPKARQEFLKVMAVQADRMAKLVKDLLSLSQIEMKMHTLPTDRVNIRSALKNIIEQEQLNADERQIRIMLKLPKTLPEVTGDKDQLSLVFDNLLSNAIKYGRAKSTVTIAADITEQKNESIASLGERMLRISFQDEGEGIPEEHIPRLTERFYRVDTSRTRKVGGTGLGLSIVKYILDRHRGALEIQSAVGKGSIFTVFLPL